MLQPDTNEKQSDGIKADDLQETKEEKTKTQHVVWISNLSLKSAQTKSFLVMKILDSRLICGWKRLVDHQV